MPTPDLRVNVAGLCLQNPIIAASGTCGYGEELHPFVDLNRLGGMVVKGLSLEPRPGNPAPRLVETTAGMLNSVGLQNIGIEAFLRDKLPRLRDYRTNVIVNFFGDAPDEYAAVAARASEAQGIAALEANISCPNVRHGGMLFSSDAHLTAEVVSARYGKSPDLPLWVKLSPNVTDITDIARAAEAAGADAISLINTVLGMAIDLETRRAELPLGFGGLSGTGHQAHRAAHGLAGVAGGTHSRGRHGRHSDRPRRAGISPRRRRRLPSGHGELRGPRPPAGTSWSRWKTTCDAAASPRRPSCAASCRPRRGNNRATRLARAVPGQGKRIWRHSVTVVQNWLATCKATVASFDENRPAIPPKRHSREGGNPCPRKTWTPAPYQVRGRLFAGVTDRRLEPICAYRGSLAMAMHFSIVYSAPVALPREIRHAHHNL